MQAPGDRFGGQALRDELRDAALTIGELRGIGDERREFVRASRFKHHSRQGIVFGPKD